MESMLAAYESNNKNSISKGSNKEEEEDFWAELIKKANDLELYPSNKEQLNKPTEELDEPMQELDNEVEKKEDAEEEDLIKDYLIEEYTKEIESYQNLL